MSSYAEALREVSHTLGHLQRNGNRKRELSCCYSHLRCPPPERRCRAGEVSPVTCTQIWPPSTREPAGLRDGTAPSLRSPSSPCPTTVPRALSNRMLMFAARCWRCTSVPLRHHSSDSWPDWLHYWGTNLRGQTAAQQTGDVALHRSVTS